MKKADNIKDGKRIPVMHGENFFVPIETMPKGKTEKCNSYIAGHSESGHHHIIEANDIEINESERAFLLKEVGKLFHKKTYDIHETKYLAPGAYKITHKTEYDPFQKIVRELYD